MINIKALLGDLPAAIQYVVIIGLILVILYVCLLLTRLIGKGRGAEQRYDDPEAYEKSVPDLFCFHLSKAQGEGELPRRR